jgi:signal transduction histidine kinase
MIGTVSHELRNNLTGVLGLTDIVANTADLQPAEARELIALAHQQAVDANEIVEDLLTASRLEAAALTISAGRVDINAEVATVARRFNGVGSEIGLVLADDLGAAWADPLRVRQAIRNLVSNAIRYGGPVVSITTRQTRDAIQINVLDNGDGVPKEDEASIFLPYRRSTTGRRDPSSIGLGLWICRHLAQAMGGHLVYERRDGSTEFVLTVPVARPDQNPTRAPASAAHIPVPFILSH